MSEARRSADPPPPDEPRGEPHALRRTLLAALRAVHPVHATSGDEGRLADLVAARLRRADPAIRVERMGDVVLALRGTPRVAVLAHLDSIGFTAGYDRALIDIGGPAAAAGDELAALDPKHGPVRVAPRRDAESLRYTGPRLPPGTRLAYAAPLRVARGMLHGPHLDDRLGVAIALCLLAPPPLGVADVAVAFTTDEEHAGKGALLAGAALVERHAIDRALVLDVTWETGWIHLGKGPAVSLRDSHLPRQAWLDRVLAAAEASGIPFQREVERSGGSDGGHLARSPIALDWCFVGPPSRASHTHEEIVAVADAVATLRLYAALVPALSA